MVRSPQLSGDRLGCGETVGNPGPKERKKKMKKKTVTKFYWEITLSY